MGFQHFLNPEALYAPMKFITWKILNEFDDAVFHVIGPKDLKNSDEFVSGWVLLVLLSMSSHPLAQVLLGGAPYVHQ